MSSDFSIVDPAEIEQEPFPESGSRHRKLTAPLGCTEMRINMVTPDPGEATAPHSHERQEEVYVALDGGRVRVDDSETGSQRWLTFGAPPAGSIGDFGEYVVPE